MIQPSVSNVIRFSFPNGVRLIAEPLQHVQSASVGVFCNTGSVNETENEAGITHFIEHMFFKGTSRRTAKQIASEIEGRGGILNGSTGHEFTSYFASVLASDTPIAIDVLADMVLNSLLDADEIAREKTVVQEEIRQYQDDPSSLVHELHVARLWPDHPLGRPVIGTLDSVGSFTRHDLVNYIDRRYRGNQILISVAGNIDPTEVRDLVESAFEKVPAGEEDERLHPPRHSIGKEEIPDDVEQVHFCIGGSGFSVYDDDRYVLAVLNEHLGGGMSSRLFQEVREQRGLAYSIGSYASFYRAGGNFTVYGGTSKRTWPDVQELIQFILADTIESGMTEEEIVDAKRSILGGMVLGLEGTGSRMRWNARNELLFGRHVTVEEVAKKIESVNPEKILSVAQRLLPIDRLRTTAIVPGSAGE
jgi:predicted Zn-dependent peptidase